MRPRLAAATAATAMSLAAASCALPAATTPATDVTTGAASAERSTPAVAGDLATLVVQPAGTLAGYRRAQFGPAWQDVDRNGCDTRNDILTRDLTNRTYRPRTHECVVLTGMLRDPYTGRTIAFTKQHATAIQIDHVVALADAWRTGAASWTAARRLQFANDPAELLAVDGPTNESKGDDDAAGWLPPNTGYRCAYAQRQIAVKIRYRLTVTPAERSALAATVGTCPAPSR